MNSDRHSIGEALAVVLSVLVILAPSCALQAGEQEEYQAARDLNTIEAWEAFLKKHPAGENAKAARESHDDLLWPEAERNASDPTALEKLFKRCKTPSGSDKVFSLWDDALWAASRNTDTPAAYRGYLLRFPGGQHVKEANAAIEEASWRHCQESGEIQLYEAYLKEHPNGAHAEEAREVINARAFQTARERDTIEAYESFLKDHYGHEAAGKRLRQLRYERAVETGRLEDWKAFYDTYRYSGWVDDGEDVAQMEENAIKEIERLLYERIVAQPTLELCRDYLSRYRDGIHKQQVLVKMEPYLFDEAVRANDVGTYFNYLEEYPEGYQDADIRRRLDTLIFRTLDEKEDFSSFERYLRLSPRTKDVLIARMEPFMFEWATRVNTVESYDEYLQRYPDGAHLKEIRTSMDPVLFKEAQEEDWYSSYEEYVNKCPNGANVQKARERIDWLKRQRAVPEITYPRVLAQPGGRWRYDTVFREKGGTIGFRVSGSGYIYDAEGSSWGIYGRSIGRGTVRVKAGGTATEDYWCGDHDSHTFCNGYASFTWTGEDAGGHPIRLEEKVEFQHAGCPGPEE